MGGLALKVPGQNLLAVGEEDEQQPELNDVVAGLLLGAALVPRYALGLTTARVRPWRQPRM